MFNIGDMFRIKTGFKSKYKGKTFVVKRETEKGSFYIEVDGEMGSFFYITTKRNHEWVKRHLEMLPLTLENE